MCGFHTRSTPQHHVVKDGKHTLNGGLCPERYSPFETWNEPLNTCVVYVKR
jgi:hypothetical protein